MVTIAFDHCKILVLAAAVKAKPKPETIRERDLLFNRVARVDCGRTLVLDHLARQEMPPVGGGVKNDVVRATFNAAFKHGLERLIGGVVAVEGKIVAKHDEPERRGSQQIHKHRQALDILAMDLDQLQPVMWPAVEIDAG